MKNVLVIGHCNMDHPRIASLVEKNFDAKATRVEILDETIDYLEKSDYNLAIINRIGAFDQESGIELIKKIKDDGRFSTHLMLVTNYQDQMDLAVQNGGVPGFGKNGLSNKKTVELLRNYLE